MPNESQLELARCDDRLPALRLWGLVWLLVVASTIGCGSRRVFWQEPVLSDPLGSLAKAKEPQAKAKIAQVNYAAPVPEIPPWVTVGQLRDETESLYASALTAYHAGEFDQATHEAFRAATTSWRWIDFHARLAPGSEIQTEAGLVSSIPPTRAVDIYHSSITVLINAAQQSGRLKPTQGIWLDGSDGPQLLPVNYHGFAWRPADFTQWMPVGKYSSTRVLTQYRRQGWGVPLVIVRSTPEATPFLADTIPFAATAMLRPSQPVRADWAPRMANELPYALELFEPHAITKLAGRGETSAPLAADLSAPLAWIDNRFPRRYLQDFLQPDTGGDGDEGVGELHMFEPYQPGKIPVILIHGLLSDPLAWLALANELMADPDFTANYQIWAFRYPTGKPFLTTAADLRRELQDLLERLSNQNPDPALRQCVLIGHSMGGLVAKVQVTHSYDQLWKAFANRPLETMDLDEELRRKMSSIFFFDPQPAIRRVIFIATPHDGSGLASTWVARLGINQVRRSVTIEQEYQNILDRNPGVVNPQFTKHLPTSVDLLQPSDAILRAVRWLPVAENVSLHSIVGINHRVPFEGDGDGYVPRESARHSGAETEFFVDAEHQQIHSHPDTVREVKRILRLHANSVRAMLAEPGLDAPNGSGQPLPEPSLMPPQGARETLEIIAPN